jgi:hypothetical protein
MKAKVINVTYRKDSETFPKWMKYEIELLHENGKTEKIPAYGKDLQDALSRVVHDMKVEKLTNTVSKIPMWAWLVLWFSYLGALIIAWVETDNHWIILGGFVGILAVILNLNWWGKIRNESRIS